MKNTTIITNLKDIENVVKNTLKYMRVKEMKIRFTEGINGESVIALDSELKGEEED